MAGVSDASSSLDDGNVTCLDSDVTIAWMAGRHRPGSVLTNSFVCAWESFPGKFGRDTVNSSLLNEIVSLSLPPQ